MSDEEEISIVICRACIHECESYKCLYKQGIIMGEVTTLGNLLSYCIGMNIMAEEKDDTIPSNICETCIQNLAKSYLFKKMVLESNRVLLKTEQSSNDRQALTTSDKEETIQYIDMDGDDNDDGTVITTLNDESELQELANAAALKESLDTLEYMTVTVVDAEHEEHIKVTDNGEVEEEVEEEGENLGDENMEVHEIVEDAIETYQSEQEESQQEQLDKNDDESEEFTLQYEDDSFEVALEDLENIVDVGEEESQSSQISAKRKSSVEISEEPKAKRPFKPRKKAREPKPANPDLQCDICGKQLSNLNSFKYHKQLHSDETPYLCSQCGEGFKTRNAYEGHMNVHDPNNPNTCEICGKMYRQSSSLRTHMLTHTGERPYQCNICGKGMTQKSGYKKHMLVHTGEKPHVCDTCGREFRYSSNLISHKRCHSGEKPYECTHCNKTFPTSDQMKRHMLVHTGERPFSCDHCGKTFKRRSSLLSHRRSYENATELIEQKVSKSNVVELF